MTTSRGMAWLTMLMVAALVVGCASAVKIEGEQLVNQRLSVKVSDAWNKLSVPGMNQPYEAWTQDGMALDQLRFWAGIKAGQALVTAPPSPPAGQTAPRVPTFRVDMPPDQLVRLFELVYAIDGSVVTIEKVEPAPFAGDAGIRFEFAIVRKSDGVHLHGMGWIAVRKEELFAATFMAPRLSFYARNLPKAQAVVATAVIKSK